MANVLLSVPVGVILPFGGTSAPAGYLACDGSAVSRTTYSRLYAVIGTAFGSGDGSTTFNLPDLRGRFLRGQDQGQGVDPDSSSRTAMASGGSTGDKVGSVQADATARPNTSFATSSKGGHTHTAQSAGNHNHSTASTGNHRHSFNVDSGSGSGGWYLQGRWSSPTKGYTDYAGTHSHYVYYNGNHTHSTDTQGSHAHEITTGGDSETRPTNAYVRFIIKR